MLAVLVGRRICISSHLSILLDSCVYFVELVVHSQFHEGELHAVQCEV